MIGSIPINIKRVESSDNKYDIGVGQILDTHSCGEQNSIIISVGDWPPRVTVDISSHYI